MNIYIPRIHETRKDFELIVDFNSIDKTIFLDKTKTAKLKCFKHNNHNLLFTHSDNWTVNHNKIIDQCDSLFLCLQEGMLLISNSALAYALKQNKTVYIVSNKTSLRSDFFEILNQLRILEPEKHPLSLLCDAPLDQIFNLFIPKENKISTLSFIAHPSSARQYNQETVEANTKTTNDLERMIVNNTSQTVDQHISQFSKDSNQQNNVLKSELERLLENEEFDKLYNFPQLGQGIRNAILNKSWNNVSNQALVQAKKIEQTLQKQKNTYGSKLQELRFYKSLANSCRVYDYLFNKAAKEKWWGNYNAVKYHVSAAKWRYISILFQETLVYQISLAKKETLKNIRDLFIAKTNNGNPDKLDFEQLAIDIVNAFINPNQVTTKNATDFVENLLN